MNGLRLIPAAAALLYSQKWWLPAAITLVFAGFGGLVRGVTSSGAAAGAAVTIALLIGAGWGGFATLCMVFALTWTATYFGRPRKQNLGTAEAPGGRDALQVLANIGVASLCAFLYVHFGDKRFLLCAGAALTEAAADTVSSEMGQALGGAARLVTTWRAVAAGTDGAVTLTGTLAGVAASAVVATTCVVGGMIGWQSFLPCIAAGMIGTVADRVLGATLERKGILGNNAVNSLSTTVAAVLAWVF
jgi:uncharacterized protein (TIGR00297 family)